MKLICGGNPVALGIADEHGNWDYEKFKEHINTCEKCKGFSLHLIQQVSEMIDKK